MVGRLRRGRFRVARPRRGRDLPLPIREAARLVRRSDFMEECRMSKRVWLSMVVGFGVLVAAAAEPVAAQDQDDLDDYDDFGLGFGGLAA